MGKSKGSQETISSKLSASNVTMKSGQELKQKAEGLAGELGITLSKFAKYALEIFSEMNPDNAKKLIRVHSIMKLSNKSIGPMLDKLIDQIELSIDLKT